MLRTLTFVVQFAYYSIRPKNFCFFKSNFWSLLSNFRYKKQLLIVFWVTVEQRFEKLRQTFWEISSATCGKPYLRSFFISYSLQCSTLQSDLSLFGLPFSRSTGCLKTFPAVVVSKLGLDKWLILPAGSARKKSFFCSKFCSGTLILLEFCSVSEEIFGTSGRIYFCKCTKEPGPNPQNLIRYYYTKQNCNSSTFNVSAL